MLIEPVYRCYRIEVNAVADGEVWNAIVTIRRTPSSQNVHHDHVNCFKLTAEHAERAGMLWAKRCIAKGPEGQNDGVLEAA